MKKWLAAMFAAGVFFVGGFGQASAADWYYIDADTTVYSNAGIALLSSKEAQKPTKIEPDTMGAEVMQALWGK